jgi:S-adenosylmethionine:tRNA ribosyltransferase-isomerase
MHQEHISMPRSTIEALRNALRDKRPIIPVGTTSLRILESLFWAAEGLDSADPHAPFFADVDQWAPYENAAGQISPLEALDRLLERLHTKQQDALEGNTRILIAPGYRFQLASGLITNFHQPESTLLLLIAALIGPDWKRVYDHALQHHFRFLSYGDSSLLLP